MNRNSTNKLAAQVASLLLAFALSAVGTACADDDTQSNEPESTTSDISEIDKTAAQTEQSSQPNQAAGVDHTSLVRDCQGCGPLPDPWTAKQPLTEGPLPDPWAASSSSGTTTTTTGSSSTTGHK